MTIGACTMIVERVRVRVRARVPPEYTNIPILTSTWAALQALLQTFVLKVARFYELGKPPVR